MLGAFEDVLHFKSENKSKLGNIKFRNWTTKNIVNNQKNLLYLSLCCLQGKIQVIAPGSDHFDAVTALLTSCGRRPVPIRSITNLQMPISFHSNIIGKGSPKKGSRKKRPEKVDSFSFNLAHFRYGRRKYRLSSGAPRASRLPNCITRRLAIVRGLEKTPLQAMMQTPYKRETLTRMTNRCSHSDSTMPRKSTANAAQPTMDVNGSNICAVSELKIIWCRARSAAFWTKRNYRLPRNTHNHFSRRVYPLRKRLTNFCSRPSNACLTANTHTNSTMYVLKRTPKATGAILFSDVIGHRLRALHTVPGGQP